MAGGFKEFFDKQSDIYSQEKIKTRAMLAIDTCKKIITDKKLSLSDSNFPESIERDAFMKNAVSSMLKLADPVAQEPNRGATIIGDVATSIAGVVDMPNTMLNDDPLTRSINAEYYDRAQTVYFPYRFAFSGMADATLRGAAPSSRNVPSRAFVQASTGCFGARVTLDVKELMYFRQTGSIEGWYGAEAMARAIALCGFQMTQRQRHMIFRSITDNQYPYYDNPNTPTISSVIGYGRLDANTFVDEEPWAVPSAGTTFKYDPNPAAKPLQWLTQLFTSEKDIIRNTMPFLRGLIMSPLTASFLTLAAQNAGNAAEAIGFATAMRENGFSPEKVIQIAVPALAGVDIYVCSDFLTLGIDETYGSVNNVEYYMPDGLIMPLFNYEDKTGNGTILFTPDERAEFLHGSSVMPSGAMPHTQKGATYVRSISSIQDPTAYSPYSMIEMGARMSFINQIAAGMSYMLKVFDKAPTMLKEREIMEQMKRNKANKRQEQKVA